MKTGITLVELAQKIEANHAVTRASQALSDLTFRSATCPPPATSTFLPRISRLTGKYFMQSFP